MQTTTIEIDEPTPSPFPAVSISEKTSKQLEKTKPTEQQEDYNSLHNYLTSISQKVSSKKELAKFLIQFVIQLITYDQSLKIIGEYAKDKVSFDAQSKLINFNAQTAAFIENSKLAPILSTNVILNATNLTNDILSYLTEKQSQFLDWKANLRNYNIGRNIVVWLDRKGGSGKSLLAKHLCAKNPNNYFYLQSTTPSSFNQHIFKIQSNINSKLTFIFDIPRASSKLDVSKIEMLLNKTYPSGAYTGTCYYLNYAPEVYIFCNSINWINNFSKDRCLIYTTESKNTLNKEDDIRCRLRMQK